MMVLLCVSNAANGLVTGLIYGMVPDTVEYGQWKSGNPYRWICLCKHQFHEQIRRCSRTVPSWNSGKCSRICSNVEQSESSLRMINICMNPDACYPGSRCSVLLLLVQQTESETAWNHSGRAGKHRIRKMHKQKMQK